MCGIFGSIEKNGINIDKNRDALQTLFHRGPDQYGEYIDELNYIGHRRLSIIDLSENAKQPMISNSVAIAINGEIYNFQELKRTLQKKYLFKSSSDSEVILHGYLEWGIESLLEKIDGMYSFIILDKNKQLLFLARDRYGIKPLYFSYFKDSFTWASELKAISQYYNTLETDYTALYDYLTYLYIPTPKTLYKNVHKLPPAHYLEFNLKQFKYIEKKYWELPKNEIEVDIDTAAEKVRKLIEKSVEAQMISDVPIGFFLSGGIDSSIVVASASKYSKQLNTYSIGFDIPSHNETKYSRQIALLFNTQHNEKILNISTANQLFEKLRTWYDEPFADTSAFPTFLVSEFAKEKSTVVLTGDGGDELFGGYEWYERFIKYSKKQIPLLAPFKKQFSELKRKDRYSKIGKIANQLEYKALGGNELYVKLLGGLNTYEKLNYKKEWDIPSDYDDYWYFRLFNNLELSPRKRLQYLDFHTYLHDDIFTKLDRVSMSVSLECRVPFMERELVEFSFSLPERIAYYKNQKKGLLKYAYRNILPETILNRPKRGFNIPLFEWNKNFLENCPTQQEKILTLFNLNE